MTPRPSGTIQTACQLNDIQYSTVVELWLASVVPSNCIHVITAAAVSGPIVSDPSGELAAPLRIFHCARQWFAVFHINNINLITSAMCVCGE